MSEIYDKDGNLINEQVESFEQIKEEELEVNANVNDENANANANENQDVNPDVNADLEKQNNYNNYSNQAPKNYSYYNENHKAKKDKRKITISQLIAVALISAIIGGMIFSGAFMFIMPKLQGTLGQILNKDIKNTQNPVQVNIAKYDPNIVTAVAQKVGPSIVGIRLTMNVSSSTSPFSFGQNQQGTIEGSGIIFKSDGYIVTNNHVIEQAYNTVDGKLDSSAKIEVFLPSDASKPFTATVVGRDSMTDLAVLKIDATNLPTVEFGDSDSVLVGETAITIGNPGGMELMGSVTAGVISGLNRTITIDNNKMMKLIQTDASINAGNSGGALVNSQGLVIGINTIKIGGQGYEGLGFAIPANTVKSITDSLINNKYVPGRPLLGIQFDTRYNADVAKQYSMPAGLYVADVTLMGGAQKAGIVKGDIITKFNNEAVADYDKILELIGKQKPGDTVKIEFYRDTDKKTSTVDVTLTENKG